MPVPTPIPPSSPRFSIRTKPTVPLDAMTAAFKASTLTHLASPSPLSLAPTPIPAPPYTSARPDVHIHLAHPSTNDAEEEGCGCDPITDESSDSPASRARALAQGSVAPAPSGGFFPPPDPSKTHPENTTVFIGGLPPSVSRAELGGMFEAFGEVIYINIPPGRGCGFVSYDNRQAAEWAIERMQGFWLRGAQLRLAWGRIQGDKPKPKSTTSNASDLSNNIKADLPFFAKMLDLSAEQQVKLGLYLEFANTGSLGRLKDILGVVSPINDTPTSSTDSALGLALGSAQAASLASLPETTSEPARRQSSTRQLPSLSEHVDRLVDSPSSSSIPSLAHTGSTHPYPTRTYHTHQHPSIDMLPTPAESPSPKVSDSSASASVSVSQSFGPPSIADEAVFRAFHPTALDHEAQNRRYQSQQSQAHEHGQEHGVGQAHHHHHHGHHHQHGENCVTPMSLQKLAQMQAVQDQVSYPISSSYGGSNGVPVGPSVNRQGFQGDAPPSIPASGAAGAREFVPSAAYQAGPAAQHNALQPGMGYAGAAMPSAGGGYGRQAAAPQMNAKAWDWMPGGRWGAGRSAAAAGGYGSGRW